MSPARAAKFRSKEPNMTQVTLICVGTLKESYWRQALAEYEKRLSAFCRFRVEELSEERIPDEQDPARVEAALRAEGERILARIPSGAYRIALCIEGRAYSSEELAAVLRKAEDQCGRIALIIGSSHGLSPAVKNAADLRLSFSPLTFPHQMVRVMTAEILYRCFSINAGRSYHK